MKIKQITIALFFGVLATMSAQDKGLSNQQVE
jgi:hypothetical protein